MNIVMIAPTPFFADRGCHTRIYGEITALQRLGYKVYLVTYGLGREIDGVQTFRCFNFPWYKKLTAGPSVWKIFLLPFITYKSLQIIKLINPDIVHAHLHEGAFAAKFCSLFFKRSSYFFDCQGSLSGEIIQHNFIKEGSLAHRLFMKLEKRIDTWFPIITQSENLYEQLLKMGIHSDKIVNAMDAVDIEMFSPREPDKELARALNIDLSSPRVLFMGLLEEYQGANLMFEAFKYVHQSIPDTQFIVIGYPNIDKYKKLSEDLGISSNTIFVGKIKFENTPSFLSLSSIAVAPKISLSEGDGKLYNYMAMEMGIVCFDRNISREILADTGLYAEMNNAKDMADQIIMLLTDSELRQKLGKSARKRAVSMLSTDISAKKIDLFYRHNITLKSKYSKFERK